MDLKIYIIIFLIFLIIVINFFSKNENFDTNATTTTNEAIQNLTSMYNNGMITSTNMNIVNQLNAKLLNSENITSKSLNSEKISSKSIISDDVEIKNINGNVNFQNPIKLPGGCISLVRTGVNNGGYGPEVKDWTWLDRIPAFCPEGYYMNGFKLYSIGGHQRGYELKCCPVSKNDYDFTNVNLYNGTNPSDIKIIPMKQ